MKYKLNVVPYNDHFAFAYEQSGIVVIVEALKFFGIDFNEVENKLIEYGMFMMGTTFKTLYFKTREDAQKALEYLDSYLLIRKLQDGI